MIGVIYQDEYAVEEAFQLLKIPWEWYDSSEEYDVVIGRKEDLVSGDVNVNLIDLSEDDAFKKVSDLLNHGVMHNSEPLCEFYLDMLRPKFNTSHLIKAFIGLILNINACESNLFILSLFIMAFSL